MEVIMNMRSLAPFQNPGTPARPEAFLFGPLHRGIDRLFEDFTRSLSILGPDEVSSLPSLMPSMDVVETDKEIVITAELPGLERKDVEVALENDVLTIRGEKVEVEEPAGQQQPQGRDAKGEAGQGQAAQRQAGGGQEAQGQDGKGPNGKGQDEKKDYHLRERRYGVFYRVLQLPAGIDPSSVQAKMSNGVLTIAIPKPTRSEAKKIEVKEAA
jgi:HSP20 family protein